jgi:Arc/MetJ-type ribon-helix-helix transcriptional regulator
VDVEAVRQRQLLQLSGRPGDGDWAAPRAVSHLWRIGLRRTPQQSRNLWYDSGMTTAKIAITLPERQLARVRRAVKAGRASSVSGYIAQALAEQERAESLHALVQDLIAEHGEPKAEEWEWAKRALDSSEG